MAPASMLKSKTPPPPCELNMSGMPGPAAAKGSSWYASRNASTSASRSVIRSNADFKSGSDSVKSVAISCTCFRSCSNAESETAGWTSPPVAGRVGSENFGTASSGRANSPAPSFACKRDAVAGLPGGGGSGEASNGEGAAIMFGNAAFPTDRKVDTGSSGYNENPMFGKDTISLLKKVVCLK